jgi:hypothetical protein
VGTLGVASVGAWSSCTGFFFFVTTGGDKTPLPFGLLGVSAAFTLLLFLRGIWSPASATTFNEGLADSSALSPGFFNTDSALLFFFSTTAASDALGSGLTCGTVVFCFDFLFDGLKLNINFSFLCL